MGIKNSLRKLISKESSPRVINLKTQEKKVGNALLSYGIRAFMVLRQKSGFSNKHSTNWEMYTISQLLLEFGYDVDVIEYWNESFVPQKEYSILIDVLSNLERLTPLLPRHCIKIFHPCWSHWIHNNQSVYKRLQELKERRGIVLKPEKQIKPNVSAELSDYITQRGHNFAAETYAHVDKPKIPIRHSTQCEYEWYDNKNYDTCRRNFLWLGGFGCLGKGLDLLLEVFSELTDCNLYICGNLFREPDFESAFYKELHETKNIHLLGFIDVGSDEFKHLAQKCVALIYPSCTELSSGAVITSMHAGMIPAVSKESGVDVGDFGVILEECSVREIKNVVLKLCNAPTNELEERSLKAWEHANKYHTKKGFEEDYRNALAQILTHRNT
jgi:glycosyl transferase family 1